MHVPVTAHVASAEAVQAEKMTSPASHVVLQTVQVVSAVVSVTPMTPAEKELAAQAVHTMSDESEPTEAR